MLAILWIALQNLSNMCVGAAHLECHQNGAACCLCMQTLGKWTCNPSTVNESTRQDYHRQGAASVRRRCWRCGCGTRGRWRAAPPPSSRTWRRLKTGWGRRCGGCCSAARPPPGAAEGPRGRGCGGGAVLRSAAESPEGAPGGCCSSACPTLCSRESWGVTSPGVSAAGGAVPLHALRPAQLRVPGAAQPRVLRCKAARADVALRALCQLQLSIPESTSPTTSATGVAVCSAQLRIAESTMAVSAAGSLHFCGSASWPPQRSNMCRHLQHLPVSCSLCSSAKCSGLLLGHEHASLMCAFVHGFSGT